MNRVGSNYIAVTPPYDRSAFTAVRLTQNAIRRGGNLILLLWLWRSVEKWVYGMQSLGHGLVSFGFLMPFCFFRLGVGYCKLIYFPISFC